jgi:hypothetical protein
VAYPRAYSHRLHHPHCLGQRETPLEGMARIHRPHHPYAHLHITSRRCRSLILDCDALDHRQLRIILLPLPTLSFPWSFLSQIDCRLSELFPRESCQLLKLRNANLFAGEGGASVGVEAVLHLAHPGLDASALAHPAAVPVLAPEVLECPYIGKGVPWKGQSGAEHRTSRSAIRLPAVRSGCRASATVRHSGHGVWRGGQQA